MKRKSILATSCAAALFLTGAAWGQSAGAVIDTEKLDDQNVVNMQGEELGEIERLLIDPQTGNVKYAVLEVGGFLGIGETEVAVPWQALQVNKGEGTTGTGLGLGGSDLQIRLDATKERLEKAPRYTAAEADRLFTPAGAEPVTSYWAVIVTDPLRKQQQQQQRGTAMEQQRQQGTTGTQNQGTVGTPDNEEIRRELNQNQKGNQQLQPRGGSGSQQLNQQPGGSTQQPGATSGAQSSGGASIGTEPAGSGTSQSSGAQSSPSTSTEPPSGNSLESRDSQQTTPGQ